MDLLRLPTELSKLVRPTVWAKNCGLHRQTIARALKGGSRTPHETLVRINDAARGFVDRVAALREGGDA